MDGKSALEDLNIGFSNPGRLSCEVSHLSISCSSSEHAHYSGFRWSQLPKKKKEIGNWACSKALYVHKIDEIAPKLFCNSGSTSGSRNMIRSVTAKSSNCAHAPYSYTRWRRVKAILHICVSDWVHIFKSGFWKPDWQRDTQLADCDRASKSAGKF